MHNKKQEQRAKMSSQKKQADNAKRRQRYAAKVAKGKQTNHSEMNETQATNDSLRS